MLESLFQMIITTSLYATIIGVIILSLKALLKNQLNPRWGYLLWAILILKLIIPFGPESAISLFNVLPATQDGFAQVYGEVNPGTMNIEMMNTIAPVIEAESKEGISIISGARAVMPYIWLFGAISLLVGLLLSHYTLHHKLKKALPPSQAILRILQGCKQRLGVTKDIELVRQESISSPALFGIFRPRILLSSSVETLNEKEISYILLHELAHYQRKDLHANYLLLGLQIIHWFNPVLWYCFKRIRQDMEVAADARVLTMIDGGEEKEYGKALLAVLESYNSPTFAPRLISMVDDKKNVERRIRMIKMSELFQSKKRLFIVSGLLSVIVLGGLLLTNPLKAQASYVIGDYTFQVSSGWTVTGNENELLFEDDHTSVGGIQILGYEPDQPLYLPNHSEIKGQKDIDGLMTKATLVNLELTEPAAAGGNLIANQNHLFLIFEDQKVAYDIYTDSLYVKEKDLLKIARSFSRNLNKKTSINGYVPDELLAYKHPYVGNHVNLSHLIGRLPYADLRTGISLQTDAPPYGLTINYDFSTAEDVKFEEYILRNNALVLFSLIDNLDIVNYNIALDSEKQLVQCVRSELQQSFALDLRDYSKNKDEFVVLLKSFNRNHPE